MANLKPTDAPTTLTKTNLQNMFDIGKGNAFNQMKIQFDIQESKAWHAVLGANGNLQTSFADFAI